MIRRGLVGLTAAVVLLCEGWFTPVSAAPAPDFQEVYGLIRTNLPGITDAELNRAAVQGLVESLSPRVSFVTDASNATATNAAALIPTSTVFERDVAYLRVGRVDSGLAKLLRNRIDVSSATNKLKGLVIDLRFADGKDYAAAADAADLFLPTARPLLNWGNGQAHAHEKNNAISLPVAVLVNGQTSRAAEALAGVLRETGVALLLGSRTAGKAFIGRNFTLSGGQMLHIATGTITLGDGSTLSTRGLTPDIPVEVTAEAERAYYADAFAVIAKPELVASANLTLTNQVNNTNRVVRRPRLNEAELVRERREGINPDVETGEEIREPEIPVIHDPALARAIDLVKGLAVVRESRF